MSAYKIWENGIHLADADYHFASKKLRAEYDAPNIIMPSKLPKGIEMMAAIIADQDEKEKFLDEALNVKLLLDEKVARGKIREEMRERLLQSLRDGKFVAYGYSIPRNQNDFPEEIPIDIFQPEYVNWGNSSLKGAGREFVSVRVLGRQSAQKISAQFPKENASPKSKSRPGRPSSGKLILAAIHSLNKEGKLPNDKTVKENCELIRKRTHENFPNKYPGNKGLSDKTIRKYLTAEFNGRGPNRKPS